MRMFTAAVILAMTAPSFAQPSAPPAAAIDRASARTLVAALADQLEQNYVFPDVASRYSAGLRSKVASGAYDGLSDGKALAAAITADLQAINPDGHLRVSSPTEVARLRSAPPRGTAPKTFIERAGWIAPGVAYIGFRAFMADEPTLAELRAFLADHADAKTLIIDVRHHIGGGLEEMDLLFSQLYAAPRAVAEMDTRLATDARGGFPFGDLPTLRKTSGPAGVVRRVHSVIPASTASGLADSRVLLLTSRKTASAGEHLAMVLKSTHRATLIGEPTMGAGHYGDPVALPGGFSVFVPTGRTFDPATGKDWEGSGIAPDIAVPADRALDEALKQAGVTATGEAALAALS